MQRYEGASTIFGPYTHMAYVQYSEMLANALITGQSLPAGPSPPDLSAVQWSLLPGVVLDTPPIGKQFGDVLVDALPAYTAGSTVSVTFVSANPRNDPRRGGTFLTVEQQQADGSFVVVFTDAHFEVSCTVAAVWRSVRVCKSSVVTDALHVGQYVCGVK